MSSELQPPCAYGKYELLERIGAGGMAEIYRARMPGLAGFSKTVVIKRLHPRYAGSKEFEKMFIDEAKLAAQVQHKNVVQVFELERVGPGDLYMAMEWVDGIDLKRMLGATAQRERFVPPWLCVHIMTEVLEALAYAHDLTNDHGRRRNIVHCDVTPENIFLSRLGDVKLADFGVAIDDTRSNDPFDGQVKGKVPYLSPEQVSAQKPDHRADVFACGIVLWESLTLHRLFFAATPTETMSRICMARRTPPSELAPNIPPELDRAVLRALEPNIDHRTPSARAFQKELREIKAALMPRLGLPDVGAAMREVCGEDVFVTGGHVPTRELVIDVDCTASSVDLLDDVDDAEDDDDDAQSFAHDSIDGFDAQLGDMIAEMLPVADSGAARANGLDEPQDAADIDAYADAFDMSEDLTVAAVAAQGDAPFPSVGPSDEDAANALAVKRLSAPSNGFTYSIIKPGHAVDELGKNLSDPIPMPGTPSQVETGDLIRRKSAPVYAPLPAAPGRHNTSDALKSPTKLPDGALLLRSADGRVLGPVGALDVIGALAHMLHGATPTTTAEISGDGVRWMPWQRFGELIGEGIVESSPVLPRNEFTGALENHSLTALFGQLARSRTTGHLILVRYNNHGIDRREISIQQGMLTGVTSNRRQFDAWDELIRSPGLQPPRIADYVQQVATLAVPLWEIAPQEIVNVMAAGRARTAQSILKEVFTWSIGQFGLNPTPTASLASTAPIPLMSVLPGVISRTKTPTMLRAAMMRLLDTRLMRSPTFQREVGELRLRSDPERTLNTFGDGQTLGESLARCTTPQDEKIALVVAYLLVELGLLCPDASVHHPS